MQAIDFAIVGLYVLATIAHRARRAPARRPQRRILLPRRQVHALVHARPLQRLRHVRRHRDDVARHAVRGLRAEEHLDPVGVAGLQPDLPDGLSLDLAAPLECADRRGVDRDALRQRHGRTALAVRGDRLRRAERARVPGLRIRRHRQVHRDLPALVHGRAVGAVRGRARERRPLLRHRLHHAHDGLRRARRHVQHRVDRCPEVRADDGRLGDRRRHRHPARRPGDDRGAHARLAGTRRSSAGRSTSAGAAGSRRSTTRSRATASRCSARS